MVSPIVTNFVAWILFGKLKISYRTSFVDEKDQRQLHMKAAYIVSL